MATRWWGLLIGGCALACSKPAPPPPVEAGPPPPPNVRWEGKELVTDGHADWKLQVTWGASGAELAPVGWPAGTRFVVGTAKADSVDASSVPSSVFGWMGAVAVFHQDVDAGRFFPPDVPMPANVPLVIELPDGAVVKTTLPPGNAPPLVVEALMAHAAKNGLVFEGEGAAPAAHTTYLLDPARADDVVGPAQTLAEIDWIAVVTSKVESGGGATCPFAGGKKYPLEKETQTITLQARRTREKLDEKVFAPAPGCPMMAFDERAIASPAHETIVAWISSVAHSR